MKFVSNFVNPRGSNLEKIYITAGIYRIRDDQHQGATEVPLRHWPKIIFCAGSALRHKNLINIFHFINIYKIIKYG